MSHDTNADNGDNGVRSTNIEVCVRIRPQLIPTTTNKFFDHIAATTSPIQQRSPPQHSRPQRPSAIPTTSTNSTPTASTNGTRNSPLNRRRIPPKSLSFSSSRKPPLPHHASDQLVDTHDTQNNNNNVQYGASLDTAAVPAWDIVGHDTVQQNASTPLVQGRTHSYTLDRVYDPSATTLSLYQHSVQPLVQSAMEGYHASVFAYGQTSTGKTYTMTGSKESPGIVPLAVKECFDYFSRSSSTSTTEPTDASPREYLLRVSYMEIYNEQIIDLLSANPQPIRMFEHREQGLVVRGLREEVVSDPEQVYALLAEGEARRQVGSTNMNKHSSRSHAIFRLWIESSRRPSTNGGGSGAVRVSSLSLVDLAGSESVRLTGSTGDRRKEGQYINKSLMTLGQVVYKLSEWKRHVSVSGDDAATSTMHIPYRDSKLTRLLQPSLSGNAQIVVICNISPDASHLEESHNTLKFAVRAKKIQQKAIVTEVTDDKTLLQSYREEIEDLKQQLQQAREAQRLLEEEQQQSAGDEDTRELVEAIRKMERLILKTQSALPASRTMDDNGDEDDLLNTELEDLLADNNGESAQPIPTIITDDNLADELHRIQGLLGSLLTKRKVFSSPERSHSMGEFSTPARDEEVETLRAQLYDQKVTTSLRKADSSFLQNQLQEKDNLLAEVSKILDAVERRQVELETENSMLREKLQRAEDAMTTSRRATDVLKDKLERAELKLAERDGQRTTIHGIRYL